MKKFDPYFDKEIDLVVEPHHLTEEEEDELSEIFLLRRKKKIEKQLLEIQERRINRKLKVSK